MRWIRGQIFFCLKNTVFTQHHWSLPSSLPSPLSRLTPGVLQVSQAITSYAVDGQISPESTLQTRLLSHKVRRSRVKRQRGRPVFWTRIPSHSPIQLSWSHELGELPYAQKRGRYFHLHLAPPRPALVRTEERGVTNSEASPVCEWPRERGLERQFPKTTHVDRF